MDVKKFLDNEPQPLSIAPSERFITLFGCVGLDIVLPDGNIASIGLGSASAIKSIVFYSQPRSTSEVLVIGRFSEFAHCDILVGGEHASGTICNYAFSALPVISSSLKSDGYFERQLPSCGSTSIGSGCLISRSCTLLSGVAVGDGAVIAAGSVVSRDVQPLQIVAGVPARPVKERFPDASDKKKFLDASHSTLTVRGMYQFARHVHLGDPSLKAPNLHRDALDKHVIFSSELDLRSRRINLRSMLGARIGSDRLSVSRLPSDFISYFKQATQNDASTIMWVADPFKYFGL